jgi:5,10-methenyltetrahydrofolate synthetase
LELNLDAFELSRFRKLLRTEKIAARVAMSDAERAEKSARLGAHLLVWLEERRPTVLGSYWPMRGEVDLRPTLASFLAADSRRRLALPVVVGGQQPLIFRAWTAASRMIEQRFGVWVPENGAELQPEVLLVPAVAFDEACYRLGYGGGFYDRTLAVADPRPLALGLAFAEARVPTIHPQAWDQPLDSVITEDGLQIRL